MRRDQGNWEMKQRRSRIILFLSPQLFWLWLGCVRRRPQTVCRNPDSPEHSRVHSLFGLDSMTSVGNGHDAVTLLEKEICPMNKNNHPSRRQLLGAGLAGRGRAKWTTPHATRPR